MKAFGQEESKQKVEQVKPEPNVVDWSNVIIAPPKQDAKPEQQKTEPTKPELIKPVPVKEVPKVEEVKEV